MSKKAYLVMPRNTETVKNGLKTSKGTLKFGEGKTSMMIGDEALANEIDTEHGLKGKGDVWVAQDNRAESFLRDDGVEGRGVHRYFWGASPKYHNAWMEFEARRKDKKRKQRRTERGGNT